MGGKRPRSGWLGWWCGAGSLDGLQMGRHVKAEMY